MHNGRRDRTCVRCPRSCAMHVQTDIYIYKYRGISNRTRLLASLRSLRSRRSAKSAYSEENCKHNKHRSIYKHTQQAGHPYRNLDDSCAYWKLRSCLLEILKAKKLFTWVSSGHAVYNDNSKGNGALSAFPHYRHLPYLSVCYWHCSASSASYWRWWLNQDSKQDLLADRILRSLLDSSGLVCDAWKLHSLKNSSPKLHRTKGHCTQCFINTLLISMWVQLYGHSFNHSHIFSYAQRLIRKSC